VRERAHADARRYLLLAQACERDAVASPVLYAVGGLIGSGKSTLADALGDALDAPVVDADRTRKFLAGVAPTTKLSDARFSGDYAPERTEAVYEEVLRRAAVVLRSGRPVVLDASFRSARWREAAQQLAQEHGVAFRFVECAAPRAVLEERLRAREAGPTVSDGRVSLLDDFVKAWEPVTELAPDEHVRIDTSRDPSEALRQALRPGDAQQLRSVPPSAHNLR
jgi:predicted kinase